VVRGFSAAAWRTPAQEMDRLPGTLLTVMNERRLSRSLAPHANERHGAVRR
jgi:hypothetical protein